MSDYAGPRMAEVWWQRASIFGFPHSPQNLDVIVCVCLPVCIHQVAPEEPRKWQPESRPTRRFFWKSWFNTNKNQHNIRGFKFLSQFREGSLWIKGCRKGQKPNHTVANLSNCKKQSLDEAYGCTYLSFYVHVNYSEWVPAVCSNVDALVTHCYGSKACCQFMRLG